ncbi:hypothetical protein [Methanobacterium sp.]|uniref:hypothetical protein n=1 Tax=Methanobacterium sp. TaxID=2164 RepID=UPI003C78FA18
MAYCPKCKTNKNTMWIYCYECRTKLKHEDPKNSNTTQNLEIHELFNAVSIKANWFLLTLIVSGSISISLVISSFSPNNIFGDLELNLGTALLGICLTVTIVDKIIKKRDDELWNLVSRMINRKVNFINSNFIIIFESFLYPNYYVIDKSIDPRILTKLVVIPDSSEKRTKTILEPDETILVEKLKNEFLNIPFDQWKKLYNDLNELNGRISKIFNNFGNRINHDAYRQLLALHVILEDLEYSILKQSYLEENKTYLELWKNGTDIDQKTESRKESATHLAHAFEHALYINKLLTNSNLFSDQILLINKQAG